MKQASLSNVNFFIFIFPPQLFISFCFFKASVIMIPHSAFSLSQNFNKQKFALFSAFLNIKEVQHIKAIKG